MAVAIDLKGKLNSLLDNVTKDLDISPTKYKQAVDRYSAVARWLSGGTYQNASGELHIFPQGSFRLGTVIRPLRGGIERDYDIDLVCKLPIAKENTSSKDIKFSVGQRLKENANYAEMLDMEGKRCWTLLYSEDDGLGFHMDILPSVQEVDAHIVDLSAQGIPLHIARQTIAITQKNNEAYIWKKSNPCGYAEWFDSINKPAFDLVKSFQKQLIFEQNSEVFNKVDDVPDQLVKTPLQRAIQVFKRHRDIRFMGHDLECEKPISMIITTLAAKLYDKENDIYSTIQNIVDKLSEMSQLLNSDNKNKSSTIDNIIEHKEDGTWNIPNPVNPSENFADRWHEESNKRAKSFFKWVAWVKEDLVDIISTSDFNTMTKSLERSLGKDLIVRATKKVEPSIVSSTSMPHINIETPNKPWCVE